MDIGNTDYSTNVESNRIESCWARVVEMQTIMVDTNENKAADKVLGRQSAAFV